MSRIVSDRDNVRPFSPAGAPRERSVLCIRCTRVATFNHDGVCSVCDPMPQTMPRPEADPLTATDFLAYLTDPRDVVEVIRIQAVGLDGALAMAARLWPGRVLAVGIAR